MSGWVTVCFRAPGCGRSVSLVWRSDVAHGPAFLRIDALSAAPEGGPFGRPAPCVHPPGRLPCDVHLWADPDGPHRPNLTEHADVLVSRAPLPLAAARHRVHELLLSHPGCLAAAVPDPGTGCVVGVRDGSGDPRYARPDCDGSSQRRVSPHAVASVVHAWVAAGRAPEALRSVSAVPPGPFGTR